MTDQTPTLRKGTRQPEATQYLISVLRSWGYAVDPRVSANRVGASIVSAVKRFQAQHLDARGAPLVVDGVVGPATWRALRRTGSDTQSTGLGGHPTTIYPDPRLPCNPAAPAGRLLTGALEHYDRKVRERPMGSNRVPELETRAQGQPWCSYWVHDRIHATGVPWTFGSKRGSTRMDLRCATERGLIVPDGEERPGDVFLLCDLNGRPYHTGLVLRRSVGGDYMDTVEGNCANRVAVRRRPINDQVVFWRPPAVLDPFDWTPGLLPAPVQLACGESTR